VSHLVDFLLTRIAEDQAALEFVDDRFASRDRWVAECNTKRRIIALVAPRAEVHESLEGSGVLILLAQPYADHPDYREAWRA
jgi:hypothetical protein